MTRHERWSWGHHSPLVIQWESLLDSRRKDLPHMVPPVPTSPGPGPVVDGMVFFLVSGRRVMSLLTSGPPWACVFQYFALPLVSGA